ncbi:GNAT family N-acetyltransferase [Clostridium botulinum]|nr:GNAT family N-acetyltransferase [Clostridium botulinum]
MKCELVNRIDESKYLDFMKNKILQKNIKLSKIYENLNNYNYYYIVCKENNEYLGVFPFILYKNQLANVINSMPFIGYGGIAVKKEVRNEVFKSIIKFLENYAYENNVDLITICTEAFEENYDLYTEYFKGDFIKENIFQYIDLHSDVMSGIKNMFKRNARKSIRYGVKIIEDNSHEKLQYWYNKIYMKRLLETGCSIYPYSVFENLIDEYDNSKSEMLYAIYENKIVGGGVFLKQDKSIDNFMRVVDSEYFKTQAGTLIDFYSIEKAIKQGVDFYNWQSCQGPGSSIFEYKQGWGSQVGKHHYITKIIKNIEKIREIPIEKIKKNFNGIYVLPYENFKH